MVLEDEVDRRLEERVARDRRTRRAARPGTATRSFSKAIRSYAPQDARAHDRLAGAVADPPGDLRQLVAAGLALADLAAEAAGRPARKKSRT